MFKMKPVVNIRRIDTAALQKAADNVLLRVGEQIVEELDDVVGDWEDTPRFKLYGPRWSGKSRRGKTREVMVIPWPGEEASQKFIWVDQGTEGPYTIRAKNAPYLVFKVPTAPMTLPMPRMIGGAAPRRERPPAGEMGEAHFVSVKEVTHPGIEPRYFVNYVVTRVRLLFRDEMAVVFKQLPYYKTPWGWRSAETGWFVTAP